MRFFGFLISLVVTLGATLTPTYAFHIGEHRKISRQAVDEFNFCMNGLVGFDIAEQFERATVEEDLSFMRKWLRYSHFFHPEKTLSDLMRHDSSIRIIELEYDIEQTLLTNSPNFKGAFQMLGFAAHHIQDATSPSHVVPIRHVMNDGFESFELPLDEMPDFSLSDKECHRERHRAHGDNLFSILEETAKTTLRLVRSGTFTARRNGFSTKLGWTAFWIESAGNTFGHYGVLGNNFGDTTIMGADNVTYEIDAKAFRAMKRAQLRLAIDATKRALHWIAAREWGGN